MKSSVVGCGNCAAFLLSANSRRLVTCTARMASSNKLLNIGNLNPHVKTMEYAVRGPLVIRAVAIEKELEKVYILLIQLCNQEGIREKGDCYTVERLYTV